MIIGHGGFTEGCSQALATMCVLGLRESRACPLALAHIIHLTFSLCCVLFGADNVGTRVALPHLRGLLRGSNSCPTQQSAWGAQKELTPAYAASKAWVISEGKGVKGCEN